MMALLTRAEFAALAGVSPQSVDYQIGRRRLTLTVEGLIDDSTREARGYLGHAGHQRRRAWRDRGGRPRAPASPPPPPVAPEQPEPGDDPEVPGALGRIASTWWNAGRGLPPGWAALCIADMLDEHGQPEPVVIYPPRDEPPERRIHRRGDVDPRLVYTELWTAGWEYDASGDGPVALVAPDGTRHPAVLKTFGEVPWLDWPVESEEPPATEAPAADPAQEATP